MVSSSKVHSVSFKSLFFFLFFFLFKHVYFKCTDLKLTVCSLSPNQWFTLGHEAIRILVILKYIDGDNEFMKITITHAFIY